MELPDLKIQRFRFDSRGLDLNCERLSYVVPLLNWRTEWLTHCMETQQWMFRVHKLVLGFFFLVRIQRPLISHRATILTASVSFFSRPRPAESRVAPPHLSPPVDVSSWLIKSFKRPDCRTSDEVPHRLNYSLIAREEKREFWIAKALFFAHLCGLMGGRFVRSTQTAGDYRGRFFETAIFVFGTFGVWNLSGIVAKDLWSWGMQQRT